MWVKRNTTDCLANSHLKMRQNTINEESKTKSRRLVKDLFTFAALGARYSQLYNINIFMPNRKGDRRERELVNLLDERGVAVMRAPASGSATDRELPDILAGNSESFYAIEAKSSSGAPIYLDSQEVKALSYFAENFGADPYIAVRFDEEEWSFFEPNELYTTPSGNYRVKKETAIAKGADVFELAGKSIQTRLGD